jgi:hypothetical protein
MGCVSRVVEILRWRSPRRLIAPDQAVIPPESKGLHK